MTHHDPSNTGPGSGADSVRQSALPTSKATCYRQIDRVVNFLSDGQPRRLPAIAANMYGILHEPNRSQLRATAAVLRDLRKPKHGAFLVIVTGKGNEVRSYAIG